MTQLDRAAGRWDVMNVENITLITTSPLAPDFRILVPDTETLAELCGAVDAALVALDDEPPWRPCDDYPPSDSPVFRLL